MPGIIEKYGASPSDRKILFYSVCIPIRLLLVYLAYKNQHKKSFRVISILLGLTSVYLNFTKNDNVWWKRDVHGYHSIVLLILAIFDHTKYIPHVLLSDVLYGFTTSIIKKPFK